MTVTVCTGFSPAGYEEYGKAFLDSFDRFWPKSVNLVAYTEEPVDMPRGECRSLWSIPGIASFISRHKDNAVYNGRGVNLQAAASEKERRAGYSYRFDAVKFCRMAVIPAHAAQTITAGDILVWLDGDVVTYKDVPEGFIEDLLGDAEVAYLGRDRKHSETGFIAFRIPHAIPLLDQYSDIFLSDRIFVLPEWHSAYVFDYARQQTDIDAKNLTPGGKGHVWFQSPLGDRLDHLKGRRKAVGRSRERPD